MMCQRCLRPSESLLLISVCTSSCSRKSSSSYSQLSVEMNMFSWYQKRKHWHRNWLPTLFRLLWNWAKTPPCPSQTLQHTHLNEKTSEWRFFFLRTQTHTIWRDDVELLSFLHIHTHRHADGMRWDAHSSRLSNNKMILSTAKIAFSLCLHNVENWQILLQRI